MPTPQDIEFGQIAVANNMITQEQLDECLNSQRMLEKMNMEEDLSSILLKKGYIEQDHVEIIFSMQGRQTGPKKIGGYEIVEKLGEGGMGIVYKARQINMDRIVALKLLNPSFAKDPSYTKRFYREARAAGKLDHPNIVRGIDVGEADGFYYFSMEFVEGESLDEFLEKKGRLTEKASALVTLQVAKALEHAHEYTIVHRDIKPDNIFLAKNNTVKLGDMGLAKPQGDASLTQAGIPVGTPYYISPEQATNEEEVDVRADIYSLGVTLYQMLTGEVPYGQSSYTVVLAKHLTEELPSIRDANPNLSAEIVYITEKMSRKEREERYQNPTELIRDLTLFLRGAKLAPDGSGLMSQQRSQGPLGGGQAHGSFDQTLPNQAIRPETNQTQPLSDSQLPQQPQKPQVPQAPPGGQQRLQLTPEDLDDDEAVIRTKPSIPQASSPSPPATEESDDQLEAPLKLAEKLSSKAPSKGQQSKISDRLAKRKGKGKVSDRLAKRKGKGKVSDRLAKRKGKVSDRMTRQSHPGTPKKGLFLFFLLLVILGGGLGAFFYLQNTEEKEENTKDQGKTGTEVAQGEKKDGKGEEKKDDKKNGVEELSPHEKAFKQIEAQISLTRKKPEKYKQTLQMVKNYLRRQPPPPPEFATKARTYEQEFQELYHQASKEAYQNLRDKVEGELRRTKNYERAQKRIVNEFPPHFRPSTPGFEKAKRYSKTLGEEAREEFDKIRQQARGFMQINRFERARQAIKSARKFGLFDSKINRVLTEIQRAREVHQQKLAREKKLEALRQKFRNFKRYYQTVYKHYYREEVKNRNYEGALHQWKKAFENSDPAIRNYLQQDKFLIERAKKLYAAIRNRVAKMASSSTPISFTMDNRRVSGTLKMFSGGAFFVDTASKRVELNFKKITPQELFETFLNPSQKRDQNFLLGLAAMQIFENHLSRAQRLVEELRNDNLSRASDLAVRLELVKRYFLEDKAARLYYKAEEAAKKKKWYLLGEILQKLSQKKIQSSFFLSPYKDKIDEWKERVQNELRKEPVDFSPIDGKNLSLITSEDSLSDWVHSPNSWMVRNKIFTGYSSEAWLIRQKLKVSGKEYPLWMLQHYRFSFQIRLLQWEKVEEKFLEIYLPYRRGKEKKARLYRLDLTPRGCQIYGTENSWKFSALDDWKQVRVSIEQSRDTFKPVISIVFEGKEIGSLPLEKATPVKTSFRHRGLGFRQLIDGQESSPINFRRIEVRILK